MSLTEGMSPADLAAVTGSNGNSLMGDGAWWIIILFLFVFCGWGGNGFGKSGNSSATDGYILTSDFANIERKLDGVNNGLCDGFYSQAQLANGINTNILQNGNASNVAMLQGFNALGTQLADCCCTNRYDALSNARQTQRLIENGFAQAQYQMATDTCSINNTVNNNTRDIIEAAHADTRAILEKLNAQELAAKEAQITELTQQVNGLRLAASQTAQNTYLVNALRPAPVPAFTVSAPYMYGCTCSSTSGSTTTTT